MTCFNDQKGRSWALCVTVQTLRRVKTQCGVTLTDIILLKPGEAPDVSLLEQLANDPVLLVDVLYVALSDEAEARGVSAQDFGEAMAGEAMAGDAIEAATEALLDEVIAFFPLAKRRTLQRLMEVSRRFAERQKEVLETLLASPDLETEIKRALTLSGSSSTAPAS